LNHASAIRLESPSTGIFKLREIPGFLFESRFSYPSKKPLQPAYLNYEKFPVFYLNHASAIRLNFRFSTCVMFQVSA